MKSNQPSQTAILSPPILYAIKIQIGVMSKGLDIQRVSLWMIWTRNKFLRVDNHWVKCLHSHLWLPTAIYGYSVWSTISKSKCDSHIRSVTHALLSGSEEYFSSLEKDFPNLLLHSKVWFNHKIQWLYITFEISIGPNL